jgi:hypothetical protein
MNTATPTIDPDIALPQVEKMLYKLAWKTAQSYPVPFEEAKSEAYYAFVRACQDFRPDKGTKFSSWCYFWVWTHLKTFVMRRSGDPLTFVEIDDDLCGEAPLEVSAEISLVKDLPNDARELFSLLCEAPRECMEGFRLLLHGDDWDQDLDNNHVQKAIRFLKKQGKTVLDLYDLNGQVCSADTEGHFSPVFNELSEEEKDSSIAGLDGMWLLGGV